MTRRLEASTVWWSAGTVEGVKKIVKKIDMSENPGERNVKAEGCVALVGSSWL